MLCQNAATRLHQLFERQAALRPQSPALVCGCSSIDYATLDALTNRMARHLRAQGVRTGDRVGLFMLRSQDAIIAILSILKAGAAYVALDPAHPDERLRYIIGEAGIGMLLTEQARSARAGELARSTLVIDDTAAPWSQQPGEQLDVHSLDMPDDALAYVLYTSGSTGRPKGVMVEHRNAVSFVESFNQVIRLTHQDRVFQGFSLSFDGSVEEMWMAFSNGGALVVPPRGASQIGNELAELVAAGQATVLSTVPTSLSMISCDLPSVRLLIVSGERCSADTVTRWATPQRRMLNVYGPTETTVNATAAECLPGAPVTIGRGLPGYQLHIFDEQGNGVENGATGELFIGGPGVTRGYLSQPELTAQCFVERLVAGSPQRLYRTGDRVSLDEHGELLFHGRYDHQVKVRGFRIELPEIEGVLAEHPAVRASVVTVAKVNGNDTVVSHVVAQRPELPFDRNAVLAHLKERLPTYMVPAYLDVVPALPTLASGKVDRKRLPEPQLPLICTDRVIVAPQTDMQQTLLHVVQRVFKNDAISIDDHFFTALGGYSLLAAQLVSELRRTLGIDVAIRDVYEHPSVEKLAARLDCMQVKSEAEHSGALELRPTVLAAEQQFESVSPWTRASTAVLQLCTTCGLFGFATLPLLALIFPAVAWFDGRLSLQAILGLWAVLLFGTWPVMLGLSLAGKWLVIGRFRPGRYPLWGFYYFRFWLVQRLIAMSGAGALVGTPLLPLYFRLMGAKVGRGCNFDSALCTAFDLVSIGDETAIGSESQLLGYRVEDGELIFGKVDIGSRCFIGTHAGLGLNVRMHDDSRLGDLSLLADGAELAAGVCAAGAPAIPGPVPVPESTTDTAPSRPILFGFLHLVVLHFIGFTMLPPALPGVALLVLVYLTHNPLWFVPAIPAAAVGFYVVYCFWVAALKKLILWRTKPGVYPIHSLYYLRKWTVDGLIGATRTVVRPLYTTIYLPSFLRLLGARIGRRAEISTVSQMSPDLTEIGAQSFFADGSIVGGRRVYRGLMSLAVSRIGRRTFIGNSAILPNGKTIGDGCLLGCLSAPPLDTMHVPNATEWLGSPSFGLPHRKKVEGFDESVTHEPTPKLIAQRLVVDAMRILIPGTILAYQMLAFLYLLSRVIFTRPLWQVALYMPLVSMALAAAGFLAVVATKLILIGTFKPTIRPLWSMFVWLNEAVNGAYESVAAPALIPLLGTPFCAPWLRLLGCKIGRRVYLETTLFSEFDLVEIHDYAALNAGAVIQNHLFEDRIMKASTLTIGKGCSVGNMAVILYDTVLKPGAVIGPLSLLMKGEVVPAGSRWLGIPTAQAPAALPSGSALPVPVKVPLRTKVVTASNRVVTL